MGWSKDPGPPFGGEVSRHFFYKTLSKNAILASALLIEGARRIGKSTVVEEFGKNEYKSYILIDFSTASKTVKELFEDISDLNYLFLQLQLQYKVDLHERN